MGFVGIPLASDPVLKAAGVKPTTPTGGTVDNRKFASALITYYRPSAGGINGSSGGGAWPGHPVFDNTWGCAAPPQYQFGTQITFRYKGRQITCPVVDRGGAITGNHFDLLPGPASKLGMIGAGKVTGQFAVGGTPSQDAQTVSTVNTSGAGGLVDAAEGVGNGIGDLIDVLTHPDKLAALLAKMSAYFFRLVGRAWWDYLISPPWHWTERSVNYYYKEVMSGEGEGFYYSSAGIVTMLFWGMGYGILWASADEDGSNLQLARTPRDSILGRSIQSAQMGASRRKLHKPSKTEAATPDKPEPRLSRATITRTRTLSATRRRAVSVTTAGGANVSSGRPGAGPDTGQPGSGEEIQQAQHVEDETSPQPRKRQRVQQTGTA